MGTGSETNRTEFVFGAKNRVDSFTQGRLCCAVNDTVGWKNDQPAEMRDVFLASMDPLRLELAADGLAA